MNSLKLRTRLAIGFATITLLCIVTSAIGLFVMHDLDDTAAHLSKRAVPNMATAYKWQVALLESSRDMRTLLLLEDPERRKTVLKRFTESSAKRAELIKALEGNIASAEGKALLAKVLEARSRLLPMEAEFLSMLESKQTDKARNHLLDNLRPVQLDAMKALEALAQYEEAQATREGAAAMQEISTGYKAIIGATILAVILAFVVATLTARAVTAPVSQAAEFADRIANGDLRSRLATERGDELGLLMRSLATMQDNLINLIREIQGHADHVARASAELVTTAEQVAVSTEHQSEAASAMASSVEEMTVSIGQIAENAESASSRTAESGQLAASGSEVVGRTGAEMLTIAGSIDASAHLVKSLQEQSREISSIADTIKGIAEQTNLLALNAAIEAARAGEEGRGFAVVADAVRDLAERTGRSTAEIGATIARVQEQTDTVFANMETAVTRVREGQTLSAQAADTIGRVDQSARQVMDSVGEISNALREQKQAAHSIAAHVEKIAQMAEENSGAVAHTRESALGLKELAARLQTSAQRFAV